MVHTLFLTNLQNFNPTKYNPLYGMRVEQFVVQKIGT